MPNNLLDRCQYNYKINRAQERLTVGSNAWWARNATVIDPTAPGMTAASLTQMGFATTGAEGKANMEYIHKNDLGGPTRGAIGNADIPLHMRQQVQEAANLAAGMGAPVQQATEAQLQAQIQQMQAAMAAQAAGDSAPMHAMMLAQATGGAAAAHQQQQQQAVVNPASADFT